MNNAIGFVDFFGFQSGTTDYWIPKINNMEFNEIYAVVLHLSHNFSSSAIINLLFEFEF